MAAIRWRTLTLRRWAIILSCAGWLPGGFLFPLALHLWSGPIKPEVFGHFLVSFMISGLIALTYSFFAVQFVVVRVFYPRLWDDAQDVRQTAGAELRWLDRRLRVFQLLAGLIPLAAAILMVGAGPDENNASSYQTFRLLVTALIALGMAGFGLALLASSRISGATACTQAVAQKWRFSAPSAIAMSDNFRSFTCVLCSAVVDVALAQPQSARPAKNWLGAGDGRWERARQRLSGQGGVAVRAAPWVLSGPLQEPLGPGLQGGGPGWLRLGCLGY